MTKDRIDRFTRITAALGLLALLAGLVMTLVAVWSGDGRWATTGAIVGVAGLVALVGSVD